MREVSCSVCGRRTCWMNPDRRRRPLCTLHDGTPEPVDCVCPDPEVSWIGECMDCRRKPYRLLGVWGREALTVVGARVVDWRPFTRQRSAA